KLSGSYFLKTPLNYFIGVNYFGRFNRLSKVRRCVEINEFSRRGNVKFSVFTLINHHQSLICNTVVNFARSVVNNLAFNKKGKIVVLVIGRNQNGSLNHIFPVLISNYRDQAVKDRITGIDVMYFSQIANALIIEEDLLIETKLDGFDGVNV